MSSTGTKSCAVRDRTTATAIRATTIALLLLACFGCSGRPEIVIPTTPQDTQVSDNGKATPDWHSSALTPAELDAQWAAWLANPGVAGVDYDPGQIIVGFKRGARLPASISVGQETTLAPAAAMPNAIMRHDHRYEQLADAIAAFSGLPIKHQVYNDHSLWASFRLEDTSNHQQQASAIAAQFASMVDYATFAGYGNPGWIPNDPDFLNDTRWEDFPHRPGEQWGQRLCNFEGAWETTRGTNTVLIGHIDDAFLLSHEELENTYLDPEVAFPGNELDLAMEDNDVTQTGMDAPHGTWVGGLLAGEENDRTIIGAAPDCRAVPFKIAKNPTYLQSNADFAAALNLAIDLGVKVVNASWGSTSQFAPQRDACTRAYDNGVLVVASVMNDGHEENYLYYPANYEFVFGVGATGNWTGLPEVEENWLPDERSFFSCYGTHVDIAAPGVHLKTSFYDHDDRNAVDLYTELWAGTSASCPLVAGAAALLWSARPSLSVDEVVEALTATGQPATGFPGTPFLTRLNAGAAMAYVLSDPTVAGTVVDHLGNPLAVVSFELSGFGNTPSDATGSFAFELVTPGSYTLTPSLTDYIFAPAEMQFELGEEDLLGLEFTGTPDYLPLVESLSIADGSVRGNVVGDTGGLAVFVNWQANGGNTARVVYQIDLAPVGEVNLYDLEIEITEPSGGFLFDFDTTGMVNQQIGITATPYTVGEEQGAGVDITFWLFNQLGDTDGSGVVDDIDLANYGPTIGLAAGEPGYSVFFDSDLDGVITEADAAAVGYFFTQNP